MADKKIISIADILKSHPEGLTITDIMRGTGLARHTVLTRLFYLMGKGDVAMRRVNMAKLHTWVGGGEASAVGGLESGVRSDVKVVALKEEHIKASPVGGLESGVRGDGVIPHKTEEFLTPAISRGSLEGQEGPDKKEVPIEVKEDPKLAEQQKMIEALRKELEEMKKKVSKKEDEAKESEVALKIREAAAKFEEKVEKEKEKDIALKIRNAAAKFEVKKKEKKEGEAEGASVPESVPVPVSTSTPTPVSVPVSAQPATTSVPKEKLDMVKIKKYIRGEISLSVLNPPKVVVPVRPKGVVATVIKKVAPVVGKLDMSKVKQGIQNDVNAGKINNVQAQVLAQRAPVSHVVENVVHPKAAVPLVKEEFLKTGVPGFDELFEDGGLPRGAAVLVAGGAGSGKTLLCLQTMINRANKGEKCLFMSFEESEERLVEHMEGFGWNPRELIASGNLLIRRFNPYEITRSVDALLMKAKGELLIEVDPIVFPENFKPDLIVVDSLTAIASAFTAKEDSYRIYIEQLFRFFEELGSTAFLITETEQIPTVYSTTGVEEFLADGVIVIYNFKRGNTRENALEVLKMRGIKHQKKIVAMRINNNGITVYPDQEVYGGIQDQ